MYLAAEATESASTFSGFDIFMVLFTILIAAGVLGELKKSKKNLFAIGFGTVSLLVFLVADAIMVKGWFGL
jgi:hypothetical protein